MAPVVQVARIKALDLKLNVVSGVVARCKATMNG